MLILAEMDDRALGSLVGTIVIVGAVTLFAGQALWRAVKRKKPTPPPPPPPRH
jgi:hypothetical protein